MHRDLDTEMVSLQRVVDQDELHPISGPNSTLSQAYDIETESDGVLLLSHHTHRVNAWLVLAALVSVVAVFTIMAFVFLDDYQEKPTRPGNPMRLYQLPPTTDALCLDGTPAAFYHSPATANEGLHKWLIFLEGISWCDTPASCASRSHGTHGSTHRLPKIHVASGILSRDPETNPVFYNFHHVFIKSCDGGGFLGNRDEALTYADGTKLYFRGQLIIQRVIEMLRTNKALDAAKQIVIAGCASGALAALLQADHIRDNMLPQSLSQYGVLLGSGFFLQHKNVLGQSVFGDQMRRSFALHNVSGAISSDCLQAHPLSEDHWQCMFPEAASDYVTSDVFVVNSVNDAWQIGCVMLSQEPTEDETLTSDGELCWRVHDWGNCSMSILNPVMQCSDAQVDSLNAYAVDFMESFSKIEKFQPGSRSGAFLHSCASHCAIMSTRDWAHVNVNGIGMQQAVGWWWQNKNATNNDGVLNTTMTKPCSLQHNGRHQCNPSCGR
eukprot:c8262_g1_i1.p1 GENE.c8262_g1_i1~~c8262_g1_i1.p1  ORF type:complete len:495 (+),score=88.75 c8262_g1_i1:63-1547(+)